MSSKIIKMKKTYQVAVMKVKICLIVKVRIILKNKWMKIWIKLRNLNIYQIFLNLKIKMIVNNKTTMVYLEINHIYLLNLVELGDLKL